MSAAVFTGNGSNANPSLQISVSDPTDGVSGSMTFQLFNNFVSTAVTEVKSFVSASNSGMKFSRILNSTNGLGAAIQGDLAPATGTNWDDDYNPNLQFTSAGMLAMANAGPDTNNTGFFITTAAWRSLDFRYTIIGFMTTETGNLLQQIDNVKTQKNSSGEDSEPVNTVSITSVTTVTDNQNGVLQLSAPAGTSGTATVTVTATDGVTGESSSQTFTATIVPDPTVDPPYLQRPISPITLTANTSKTFQIPGTITSSGTINYNVSMSPANANLTLTPVNSTGEWTLTAANGNAAVGVFTMDMSVQLANPSSTEISSADAQAVPVYISPLAPTKITFLPAAGLSSTITDLNNSTASEALQFKVDGVVAGATVDLYAGATQIGTDAVPSGATSVTFLTNGSAALDFRDLPDHGDAGAGRPNGFRRQPEHGNGPGAERGLRGDFADDQHGAGAHAANPHADDDPPEHAPHVPAEQLYQQRNRNPRSEHGHHGRRRGKSGGRDRRDEGRRRGDVGVLVQRIDLPGRRRRRRDVGPLAAQYGLCPLHSGTGRPWSRWGPRRSPTMPGTPPTAVPPDRRSICPP